MARFTSRKMITRARCLRRDLTPEETLLWQVLRSHQLSDIHFRRQHPIGPYIVDFCTVRHKLIIEVDGYHHLMQEEYDRKRTLFLNSKGFRVIRFWNRDVRYHRNEVVMAILETLQDIEKSANPEGAEKSGQA